MILAPRSRLVVALAAAAILFVAVNVIAGHDPAHDAPRSHPAAPLHALRGHARRRSREIDEPITLRFYYSPRLGDEIPSYGVYAQRVREMLEEYAAARQGQDQAARSSIPSRSPPTEDRAVAFGLQGVPLDQGGEQVYFGLAATNSTDDQQTSSPSSSPSASASSNTT